uniref:Uncharacterized protein n=1 Tax=Globisporangium ultimum (strain ATCC 200006 / CBS 805.95 / DAOM BR144) TaxID=431595 RepID=K3W800_GLOUD
ELKRTLVHPVKQQQKAALVDDYDVFYQYCSRLVAYITAHMVTSPEFVVQMDRLTLACHTKLTKQVLYSVVTKNVWFHHHD